MRQPYDAACRKGGQKEGKTILRLFHLSPVRWDAELIARYISASWLTDHDTFRKESTCGCRLASLSHLLFSPLRYSRFKVLSATTRSPKRSSRSRLPATPGHAPAPTTMHVTVAAVDVVAPIAGLEAITRCATGMTSAQRIFFRIGSNTIWRQSRPKKSEAIDSQAKAKSLVWYRKWYAQR